MAVRPTGKQVAAGGLGIGAFALLLNLIPLLEGRTTVAVRPLPGDVPTLCYGHQGHDVKMGDKADEGTCIKFLTADLNIALAIVDAAVEVPISQEERAAYGSFVYNVGKGKKGVKDGFVFLRSGRISTMLRKINAGDRRGACLEFPKWANFKGKIIKGLANRRAAEMALCLKGVGA